MSTATVSLLKHVAIGIAVAALTGLAGSIATAYPVVGPAVAGIATFVSHYLTTLDTGSTDTPAPAPATA